MFGNFSLFKTPFPGRNSVPPSFVLFFCLVYFFSYLLLKSWVAFLGAWCPLPAFRSCFVEFTWRLNVLLMNLWGRVFSPSYSSAILAPPPWHLLYLHDLIFFWDPVSFSLVPTYFPSPCGCYIDSPENCQRENLVSFPIYMLLLYSASPLLTSTKAESILFYPSHIDRPKMLHPWHLWGIVCSSSLLLL